MQRQSLRIWKFLKNLGRREYRTRPLCWSRRPCLETLENRLAPSTLGNLGVISGQVFVDSNGNHQFDPGELTVPGAQITLNGTTTANQPINLTATTDANGKFTFFQVQPGTYQLSRGSLSTVLFNPTLAGSLGGIPQGQSVTTITVDPGQVGLNYNFPVLGIAPQGVSLRDFVTNSAGPQITNQAAGAGQAFGDGLSQYASPVAAGTASLGGTVFNAATFTTQGGVAASGLAGVQVTLTGLDSTGNSLLLTTTTGANGSYQFTGLNKGSYTLSVPQQPAGFRAGLPSAGSLGGISTHNNQLTNINVAAGASGTSYNFGEVPVGASSGGSGPALSAMLADDTGASATDGITSDPAVQGSVTSSGTLSAFAASLDNGTTSVNLLSLVGPNGSFLLNRGLMNQVAGGTLADGTHTLHLASIDSTGATTNVNVTFTLLTAPPSQQPNFAFTPGSGVLADLAPDVHVSQPSSSGSYSISGTATPGMTVQLLGAGTTLTTTANAAGAFGFSGVPLATGANQLTVLALDAAGNSIAHSAFFLVENLQASGAIPTQSLSLTARTPVTLSLAPFFSSAVTGTTVQYETSSGPVVVQLFDNVAPQNVANFLHYANDTTSGSGYENSIFDRLIPNFVLQGGSFNYDPATNQLTHIVTNPTVQGEHNLPGAKSNVTGTLALALPNNSDGTTNDNGGTSAYFFNMVNNSGTLDPEGFTVFGQVADGESMRVLNTLSTVPTQDQTSFDGALANIPLINYNGSNFPTDTTVGNFEFISAVNVLQQAQGEALSFSASVQNPSLAVATVNNGVLTLTPVGNAAGSTVVTITATDRSGFSVQSSFTLNLS